MIHESASTALAFAFAPSSCDDDDANVATLPLAIGLSARNESISIELKSILSCSSSLTMRTQHATSQHVSGTQRDSTHRSISDT